MNRSIALPDARLREAMRLVLLACMPGLLALLWIYGWGVLFNLLLMATVALLTEAALLRLRRRPVLPALTDGSAVVSAVLLAAALPAHAPWWLAAIAHCWAGSIWSSTRGGIASPILCGSRRKSRTHAPIFE